MKANATTLMLVLSCSSFFGCGPGPKEPMEPPLDTVDPARHEPYQPQQPLTTGNPMSDTDSRPQVPGTIASPPSGEQTTTAEPATDQPRAAVVEDDTLAEEEDTVAPLPKRERPSAKSAKAETAEDEEPVDPRANPAEPR